MIEADPSLIFAGGKTLVPQQVGMPPRDVSVRLADAVANRLALHSSFKSEVTACRRNASQIPAMPEHTLASILGHAGKLEDLPIIVDPVIPQPMSRERTVSPKQAPKGPVLKQRPVTWLVGINR